MAKSKTVLGFKGTDSDLKCRDFQYEVGKTYTHKGDVSLCNKGFHFCENALDVFGYYPPADSRYFAVKGEGTTDETSDDSKRVSKKLTLTAEIKLPALIDAGVKFILSKVDFENAKESNTGDYSAATNTGYQSAATNTGGRSAATNTGDYSAATNTGYQSAATNTGDYSAATNTGVEGVAISVGIEGKARAKKGGWITLAEWKRDGRAKYGWKRIDVQTVKVDGKKIKANTFYMLQAGEFVEVK